MYLQRSAALLSLGLVACGVDVGDQVTGSFSGTGTDSETDASTGTGSSTSTGTTGSSTGSSTGTSSGSSSSSSSSGGSTSTGPIIPGCTNGVLEAGEQCDDGNTDNNDGCSNDCANPGVGLWQTFRDNFGSEDRAFDITVDSDGNVLITGTEEPALSDSTDMLVAKFNGTDGSDMWAVKHNGPLNLDDLAWGITTDSEKSAFMTGGVLIQNNGLDVFLGSWDSNGQKKFDLTYNGPVAAGDEGRDIVADALDNVIIAGTVIDPLNGGANAWLRKYDPVGTEVWTTIYNGPNDSSDEATSIVIDGNGDIIAGGYTRTDNNDDDVWIGKYSTDGVEIWTTTWNGSYNGQDQAMGVAVDPDGNIFATGHTQVGINVGLNPITDLWTGKFDSLGTEIWTREVDGPIMGYDWGEAVAADSKGNAIVCGSVAIDENAQASVFNGLPLVRQGWVRKYTPDGDEAWTHTYGPDSEEVWCYGVALDAIDNIFITGQVLINLDLDIIVRKISP